MTPFVDFERLVVLDGMPRSGTSWLSQIVESCPIVQYRVSPLFAYDFKGRINPGSNRDDWIGLLREVYESDNEYMLRKRERNDGRYPRFARRAARPPVLALKFDRFHDLLPRLVEFFAADGLKVACIVRHPCGAIHSWLTAPREFPPDADPLLHWRSGAIKKREWGDFFGFDDWKTVTQMQMDLARRFPDTVRLLRYEALVDAPEPEAERLFSFLDLPMTDQTRAFLRASHAAHLPDPYAVFKAPSVKDRWRTELRPDIREAILSEISGTPLSVFLD